MAKRKLIQLRVPEETHTALSLLVCSDHRDHTISPPTMPAYAYLPGLSRVVLEILYGVRPPLTIGEDTSGAAVPPTPAAPTPEPAPNVTESPFASFLFGNPPASEDGGD